MRVIQAAVGWAAGVVQQTSRPSLSNPRRRSVTGHCVSGRRTHTGTVRAPAPTLPTLPTLSVASQRRLTPPRNVGYPPGILSLDAPTDLQLQRATLTPKKKSIRHRTLSGAFRFADGLECQSTGAIGIGAAVRLRNPRLAWFAALTPQFHNRRRQRQPNLCRLARRIYSDWRHVPRAPEVLRIDNSSIRINREP